MTDSDCECELLATLQFSMVVSRSSAPCPLPPPRAKTLISRISVTRFRRFREEHYLNYYVIDGSIQFLMARAARPELLRQV